MLRKMSKKAVASILAASAVALPVTAQEVVETKDAGISERTASSLRDGTFSAEISAGVEYDSNVSVIEIDTQIAEDDFAAVIDLGLEYETDLSENTTFEIGYDFGQDIQFDFTDFNTQIHRGSVELSHDFGAVDGGVSYQFVYSRLGGDGFLRLHRLSPYAATYLGDRQAYVRASYIYTDKEFIGRTDRDSSVHAGSAEIYYFVNGLDTYLIGGYRYESEDAVSPEFDFESHNVKARLVQRIEMGDRKAKLRAGWRYENRDYSAVTPSIGVVRDDDRHKFDVSLEVPLNDIMYGEVEYNYDAFNSNLPSADFNQSVATFRIGGRL